MLSIFDYNISSQMRNTSSMLSILDYNISSQMRNTNKCQPKANKTQDHENKSCRKQSKQNYLFKHKLRKN